MMRKIIYALAELSFAAFALALLLLTPIAARAVPAGVGAGYSVPLPQPTPALPNFTAGLNAVLNNTADARWCDVGDSETLGYYANASGIQYTGGFALGPTAQLYNLFRKAGIPASMASVWGEGLAYAHAPGGYPQINPLLNYNGAWGTANELGYTGFGGPAFVNTSNNVAMTYNPGDGLIYDTVDVYYISTTTIGTYGTFNVSINGNVLTDTASNSTINTDAAVAYNKITFTFPAGVNPNLAINALSGNVLVQGWEFRSSVDHRFLFRNPGWGGSTTSNWYSVAHPWQWPVTAAALNCTVTRYALGVNDFATGVSPATTQSNTTAMLAASKAANSDIILVTPFAASTSTATAAAQLATINALKASAQIEGAYIIDENARQGSYAAGLISGLDFTAEPTHPAVAAYIDEANTEFAFIMSSAAPASSSVGQTQGVTLGASPYTYTNTTTVRQDVIVSGGTVSAISFCRVSGTCFSTGLTAGMFSLSPNDSLSVTYSVVPTMTGVPR